MADFTRNSAADIAAGNPGINMGTTGSLHDINWGTVDLADAEDSYWRDSYATRPYARGDRSYDFYRPAYRYGSVSASHLAGREWDDASSELERGWDAARGESGSAWHEVKDAVRDAWDRVRGRR